jgi:hypothetical protein
MVEWHTVGPYRVSFDVRPDASRFIVLLSWAPGTWLALSERVIARGLIEGNFAHPNGPYLIFDDAVDLESGTEQEILRLWTAMRDQLRQR